MKRLRHYNQGTAIVLCCFGSVVEQARYLSLQQRIANQYPNCEVKLAVSSKMVVKKLAKQGEHYQNLPQVMADLDMAGFQRILVVSCYLFPTDEHLQLCNMVQGFRQFSLANIEHTPAILHHTHHASNVMSALDQRFSDGSEANLFVHHGAPLLDNPGHQAIHYCDSLLARLSERHFSCSLEGAWPFHLVANSLQQQMLKGATLSDGQKARLCLIPLLLVSGNHFVNDLAQIKARFDDAFDVSVAEPVYGDKFCLLDLPELLAVIDQQVAEGLTRLQAPASETNCG